MALHEIHPLLLIFTVAAVAPLMCEWIPRIRLPLVVLETVLGIQKKSPRRRLFAVPLGW
jgi:hypothetical protein